MGAGFIVRRGAPVRCAEEQARHREARQKLRRYFEIMNDLLEPHRDPCGFVAREYEGYEEVLSGTAVYLVDLERAAGA